MMKELFINTFCFGALFFTFHLLVLYVSNGKIFRAKDAIESAYLACFTSIIWFISFYCLNRIRSKKNDD